MVCEPDTVARTQFVKSAKEVVMSNMRMALAALLLLLLNPPACCGFGFKGCSQNYKIKGYWCFNRNIANLTDVISMIPDNATKINLSKNKIRDIPAGSLSRLTRLKDLDLSQNKIVSLKGGEFRGLKNLENLNLTCNNISYIHSKAFEGLTRLRTLLLVHNMLVGNFSHLFNFLPVIRNVDLSLNKLSSFSCEESGGSSTLKHLDLLANNIQALDVSCFPVLEFVRLSNNTELELQPDTFASNPKLRFLHLLAVNVEMLLRLSAQTKGNLTWVSFSLSLEKSPWTICEVLRGMDNLEKIKVDLKGSKITQHTFSLLDCSTPEMVVISDANFENVANFSLGRGNTSHFDLINCGLKEISQSTFEGYPHLEELQLNSNKVVIQWDAFRNLTNLTLLSFDKNKMSNIDPNWFIPLKRLTRLSLMKNQITDLAPKALSTLTQLEQLYLQFNLLKYITTKAFSNLRNLWKLNLSGNIIDFIEEGSFKDLTNLRYLDISGNRIKRLTPRILAGLHKLKSLVLYNNRLHFKSYETPFMNLISLEYLQMIYQGPGGQGIGTIGPFFFKGPERLGSISMGNSIMMKIHPDAFAPLIRLKNLYIAGVIMKETNLSAVLSPLRKLLKLTLNRADLDTLPANLLPPNNMLEILNVQSNHIRTVDKAFMDALPRLRSFAISENPLSCTCDNSWFKTWAINDAQTQVTYLYNLHCENNGRLPYLWQFDDKACSYEQVSFTLFITCSVLDVLFVCVCLAWHAHGPAMRYLLLIIRAKLRGRKGPGGARYQFDAFISYSSMDEEWVMRQLVPNLERPVNGAPRLRLCLHHRDFRPGAAVLENIEAAIYSSRHTLCVVTHHYLQSEWCSVEFQLASLRLLCDGSDVLLLVFLEEIPEHCLSPYTRLRKIVRRNTYLLWPEKPQEQDAFWVRLIDALKDNEGEEEGGRRADELAQLIG